MRVKLDENLPLPVQFKSLVTASGHDAATAVDKGLGGAPDGAIASAYTAEERVLITLDLDFADIRTYPPKAYAGTIVFRLPRAVRDAVLAVGAVLIERLKESSPEGQLWIADDSRIRIRE